MSQTTDTTLSDQSGASFRTELNSIISALNTDFTGATAPVTPEAYMRWVDTSVSPNVLRRRNAANTAWELHPTQQLATDAMPKSGGTFTGAYNGKQGADIASAATTDIGAATGNSVNVTGVTTITSLGSPAQAGIKRTVTFTGILTLTHNATTLILPSAANIKTAAGDVAEFISTATGWRCTNYIRANGLGGVVDGVKGADIASAATTDIGAATGDYVVITGTNPITSLGTANAGVRRTLRFSSDLSVIHNSTSLILIGGESLIMYSGDIAVFISEGAGNWRMTSLERASTPSEGLIRVSQQSILGYTLVDFTAIPDWVDSIEISLYALKATAASNFLIQVGNNTPLTTGYSGSGGTTSFTNGFGIPSSSAANTVHGVIKLTKQLEVSGDRYWTASGSVAYSNTASAIAVGGSIFLSGTNLNMVRVTTAGGTATFTVDGNITLTMRGKVR